MVSAKPGELPFISQKTDSGDLKTVSIQTSMILQTNWTGNTTS